MTEQKLNKIPQPIFAVNSGATGITEFGSVKQTGKPIYTTDVSKIFNEAYAGGWNSATVAKNAPIQQDFNALFYALSRQLSYLYQYGIPTFDITTTYFKGSVCTVINEAKPEVTLYQSLTDNNKGNDPLTSTENWAEIKTGGGGGHTKSDIGSLHFSSRTDIPAGYLPVGNVEYDTATQTNYKKFYDEYLATGLLKTGTYTEYNQAIVNNWQEVPKVYFQKNTLENPTRIVSDKANSAIVFQVFNGAISYTSTDATNWIQEQFEASYILKSYKVGAANVSAGYPTAWTVSGSLDGQTWVDLDTQTGQTFTTGASGGADGEVKIYDLDYNLSTHAYSYYRITFSATSASNYGLSLISFDVVNQNEQCCGFWGIDTVNAKFKTPCMPDRYFLASTNNTNNLGMLTQDQIVNMQGGFGLLCNHQGLSKSLSTGANGVFTRSNSDNQYHTGSFPSAEQHPLQIFDASRVVNTGDRVQPRNIQYRLLVYIGGDADYLETETISRSELDTLIQSKINAALAAQKASITLSSCLVSDFFAIPAAQNVLNWNHGLNLSVEEIQRAYCRVELVCQNAVNGYNIGDTAICYATTFAVNTTIYFYAMIPNVETNNAAIIVGGNSQAPAGTVFYISRSSPGTIVGVPSGSADWKLRFKLWYNK